MKSLKPMLQADSIRATHEMTIDLRRSESEHLYTLPCEQESVSDKKDGAGPAEPRKQSLKSKAVCNDHRHAPVDAVHAKATRRR